MVLIVHRGQPVGVFYVIVLCGCNVMGGIDASGALVVLVLVRICSWCVPVCHPPPLEVRMLRVRDLRL